MIQRMRIPSVPAYGKIKMTHSGFGMLTQSVRVKKKEEGPAECGVG